MKRFFAILLAAIMLLALISCDENTTLIEEDELTVTTNRITNNDGLGYFTYEVNKDGHYSITGYETVSAKKHAIDIPETIEDITVTGIAAEAFKACTNLTDIKIPATVTFIEELAFYGCDSLTTITLPDSIVEVGAGAFRECTSLESVILSKNLQVLSDELFWNCTSLTDLGFDGPDYTPIEVIGAGSCYGCTSLTDLKLGSGKLTIGDAAFCGSGLTTIYVGSSAEFTLGEAVFANLGGELTIYADDAFVDYITENYPEYNVTIGE